MCVPHILFVDDDRSTLKALEHLVKERKPTWQLSFVDGGAEALSFIDTHPVDVVVTDMRMPEVGGGDVLKHLLCSHPRVVRVVHSSTAEWDVTGPLLTLPHDILDKPCSSKVLIGALERCVQLAQIPDDDLRAQLAQPASLPARPKMFMKVCNLLDGGAALAKVGQAISEDVGIAAKVLHLANTALFSRGERIETIEAAVARLGGGSVRGVVIAAEAMRSVSGVPDHLIERLNRESYAIASLASEIAPRRVRNFAFLAGLLRDIGKIVVAAAIPEQAANIISCTEAALPIELSDHEVFEIEHSPIGAHLLRMWNLPEEVVTAVLQHHRPEEARDFEDLVWTLHIAESIYFGKDLDVPKDQQELLDEAHRAGRPAAA